ncbi:hypothetical protein ABVB18_21760 [Xanthomonas citri pv. mangiferaeindicae]|uniref:hypothetical protein n=2 Tax=Xanthomonas citri TaxID=346 RepID=UPI001CFDEEA0|nr:hypothetical protein [Xanthomonas citri]UDB87016.1 hypothetical protein LCZ91_14190 [Xanthomonas citri pv. mangiferaeindicae]
MDTNLQPASAWMFVCRESLVCVTHRSQQISDDDSEGKQMAHPVATNADLADALAALDARDDAVSSRYLERAARQGSIMGRAIRDVLDDGNSRNAYDKPLAFELFVRGGGNLALYEAVSAELAKLYDALLNRPGFRGGQLV